MGHTHESTIGPDLMGQLLVHLLSLLFCALPLRWAMGVGRTIGYIWYYGVPVRRALAHRQVAQALGPTLAPAARRRIVKESFVNLTQMAIEGLRAPLLTPQWSEQIVARKDFHYLHELLKRGKGVVAVSIHMGNFELLGTSQTVRGYKINAVFKDIGAAGVAAFWHKQRQATKLGHIPPRNAKDIIRGALGRNEVVAFLIDQHLAPYRSIVCRFFGMLAATTPAPIRFAMETGAPILPLFIARTATPGHHEIRMFPEFILEFPSADAAYNLAHNTQRLNDLVEGWIRAYPEQWLWAHRRWKVSQRLSEYTLGAHLAGRQGTSPNDGPQQPLQRDGP